MAQRFSLFIALLISGITGALYSGPSPNKIINSKLKLNKYQDSVFRSFGDFAKNDSIVFIDSAASAVFKIKRMELQITRPQVKKIGDCNFCNNAYYNNKLDKPWIEKLYASSAGTIWVSFTAQVIYLKNGNERTEYLNFKIEK
jgi:hypothetical protein